MLGDELRVCVQLGDEGVGLSEQRREDLIQLRQRSRQLPPDRDCDEFERHVTLVLPPRWRDGGSAGLLALRCPL